MQTSECWAGRFERELTGNILPFWMTHAVDRENGGFYGYIGPELRANREASRASVVNTRILWTFAAATRLLGSKYRGTADRAYEYVANNFLDRDLGGVFWTLDRRGRPISDRKQTYAQAFAIYALSEYFRATGDAGALDHAKRLFGLIERHSYDPVWKGYIEARARNWSGLDDMRLSDKDLNCPKSMNTHLHLMEAYTNLLRAWRDPEPGARLAELLEVTMDHIIDARTGHFKLFFDEEWNSLSDHVSFGHDIEGSWLLVEAAEVLGHPALIERARRLAVGMAEAVYAEGRDTDGSLFYEADPAGRLIDANKHWWVQAESVVGFYNAYELTGDAKFREQAERAWDYIESHFVDRVNGEWHAKLRPDGTPYSASEDPDACLAGPWKCPYHNARVCYEMMARLRPGRSGIWPLSGT